MRLVFVALVLLASAAASSSPESLSAEQALGRMLYLDVNLSLERNQSCNSCHAIEPVEGRIAGFVDPANVRDASATSTGSPPGTVGALNAPSVGYARFTPPFHWDGVEGLYVGGLFWNGRATSLAEQAKGPPLNPLEMAMPSKWAVVSRLKQNPFYVERFAALYGVRLDAIEANETAPAAAPAPPGVDEAYDAMADAIAAFEKSRFFNRFTSKFDYVLAGRTEFTAEEQRGLEVFRGDKAMCAECHPVEPLQAPDGRQLPPLFTDFTYDNIGLPRNRKIPGDPAPNQGLGGRPEIAAIDPAGAQLGKHKVMGLRNIALTPPYMHNGSLATLEAVVHFYNTRDAKQRVCEDNRDPGFGKDCWPAPEVARNVNTDELGDLGLDAAEEADIVAFMRTLTDGYPEWGDDPKVPPGTPSPFADTALPPAP